MTFSANLDEPGGDTRIARSEREAREVAPAAPSFLEPKLALIDFGMTAHLSPTLREQCIRLLYGLSDDRGEDVADVLIEMGDPLDGFDRVAYAREINELVAHAYGSNLSELEAGAILNNVIAVSYQRGLRLPADLTLLAKTLVHLGGVTRSLDPGFEPAGVLTIQAGMESSRYASGAARLAFIQSTIARRSAFWGVGGSGR